MQKTLKQFCVIIVLKFDELTKQINYYFCNDKYFRRSHLGHGRLLFLEYKFLRLYRNVGKDLKTKYIKPIKRRQKHILRSFKTQKKNEEKTIKNS